MDLQKQFSTRAYTSSLELKYYKRFVAMGLILAAVSIVLEIFVARPGFHGMWSLFALAGLAMAYVFSLIIAKARQSADEAAAVPTIERVSSNR